MENIFVIYVIIRWNEMGSEENTCMDKQNTQPVFLAWIIIETIRIHHHITTTISYISKCVRGRCDGSSPGGWFAAASRVTVYSNQMWKTKDKIAINKKKKKNTMLRNTTYKGQVDLTRFGLSSQPPQPRSRGQQRCRRWTGISNNIDYAGLCYWYAIIHIFGQTWSWLLLWLE